MLQAELPLRPGKQDSPPDPAPCWQIALAGLCLVFAGWAAYSNSFRGPFVYDDLPAIVGNPTIQGDWWNALTPPPGGRVVAGRPLVNLTLALNYQLGGFNPAGYHLANLLIHLLSALTLFGLVRRTLLLPSLRGKLGADSWPIALAVALVWMLHPLQTESVSYIAQRTESLMALFYLLTLYCFARGVYSPHRRRWFLLSFLSCLAGVFSKEVMVTAPIMVWLYDRTFVSGRFKEALCRHWGIYAALAATWIPLGWGVWQMGTRGNSAGWGSGVAWWEYAFGQFPILLNYLWLCVWPAAQSLDYGNELPAGLRASLPAVPIVTTLLAFTLWALVRKPMWGFFGAWFFLILMPTSSILPIATEPVAEHRMYLPLAAIAVLFALGLKRMLAAHLLAGASVAAIALAALTFVRNRDYQSVTSIWRDAVAHNPAAARPNEDYGIALAASQRYTESAEQHRRALRLDPESALAEFNLASVYLANGLHAEAIIHYQAAVRIKPDFAAAHNNLGMIYLSMGKLDKAVTAFESALRIQPKLNSAQAGLATALRARGQLLYAGTVPGAAN